MGPQSVVFCSQSIWLKQ